MDDQNNQMSVYAKKLREAVKVLIFMLRKSKRKLLVDLNLALKRGKLAGKSLIGKLAHHHNHNHHQEEPDYYSAAGVFNYPDPKSSDYVEFSCSNTPAHHNNSTNHHNFLLSHVIIPSLHLINDKKAANGTRGFKTQYETVEEEFENAVESALSDAVSTGSPISPFLGYGQSPGPVRQLRVTDSPFPISSTPSRESAQVDAAADAFIKRFYSQLKRQPITEG